MEKFRAILLLAAAAMSAGLATPGAAAVDVLTLEEVRTTWGTPYDVSLERTGQGVTVSGKIRASLANTGRRLYGRVWAELVDRSGETIAVHYGDPRRLDVARHTHRAGFTIAIEQLPADTAGIRVGYR